MRCSLLLVAVLALGCEAEEPEEQAGHATSSDPDGAVAETRLTAGDGRTWDVLGRPVEGDHAGLEPLVGYNQFWFAWSVFQHGSSVFGSDDPVDTAPIEAEEECGVPCDELELGCPGTDCIPALTRPEVVSPDSSDARYVRDDSFVVGVAVGDEARAYPHNVLWWHEIVNDEVGGQAIAVTHCPLTFSTVAHDPRGFIDGETVELGVSGRLYNSNLVFYNRSDNTWFSQLLGVGTRGAGLGNVAPRVPSFEMTWAAWRSLFPDTQVLSEQTGHARNYAQYPYGSYFRDDSDTFRTTNPRPDSRYGNKTLTYGLTVGGEAKAYPWPALSQWAREADETAPPRGVLNDELGGRAIAIVFDLDAAYVQAFDRADAGELQSGP